MEKITIKKNPIEQGPKPKITIIYRENEYYNDAFDSIIPQMETMCYVIEKISFPRNTSAEEAQAKTKNILLNNKGGIIFSDATCMVDSKMQKKLDDRVTK